MTARVRRLLLAFHFWSGLVLGGWFVLLGLTGSVLVFYVDIDQALNPALRVAQPVTAAPSVTAIERALRQAYPDRPGPWRIELPGAPDMPVMARYYHPAERAGRYFAPLLVTLAPDSLAVTSERFWGDTLMTWVFDLHYTLLLGKTGLQLVGLVGLANLLVMISGIYLWWPSRARFWTALRIVPRPGAVRRAYDMHCSSGVYWLVLLGVLCLTGAALAFPDQTKALVRARAPAELPFVAPPAPGQAKLPLDRIIANARQQFPQAELRWVETSGAGDNPVALRLYQPGEPGRRFPQTRVWLDPYTGAVLDVDDPRQANAGTRAFYWMHPLHNGEAFGLPGRLAVCLAGGVPFLLLATGLVRWRHKRRARAQAARVKQQAAARGA